MTLINLILFALSGVLVLLGRPLDAVITVAVISFNMLVGIVQEVRAKRALDHIALLTRPTATVIRAGHEHTVDPSALVVGDLLVVRPGDQIVVDGRLIGRGWIDVDESLLTGESDLMRKSAGDSVSSGSFCVNGSAVYEAVKVGAQSTAYQLTTGARTFRRVLTPLQRQVTTVIRILLVLACYLGLNASRQALQNNDTMGKVCGRLKRRKEGMTAPITLPPLDRATLAELRRRYEDTPNVESRTR